tara:strand:- start:215 stop:337 length:123 start_codon:yes stop_codon:yes gene_type:complete
VAIIARLSKLTNTKVPDEDVVELGRKITVLQYSTAPSWRA